VRKSKSKRDPSDQVGTSSLLGMTSDQGPHTIDTERRDTYHYF